MLTKNTINTLVYINVLMCDQFCNSYHVNLIFMLLKFYIKNVFLNPFIPKLN